MADPSSVLNLADSDLEEIRGGISLDIALQTAIPAKLQTDNPQITTSVTAGIYNPQDVYCFHGGTKTKSKTIALSGGNGTGNFRVPVRPNAYTPIGVAWWGDCDANGGTSPDFCIEDTTASASLQSSIAYRAVRFHNTRSPASGSPTTAMLQGHGQRFIDDDAWTWSSSRINVDWVWSNSCGSTSNKTAFGLAPFSQNYATNANSLMPISSVSWANIPGLGNKDCTELDNSGSDPLVPEDPTTSDGLNWTNFDTYCLPKFRSLADAVDASRRDIHIFVIQSMPTTAFNFIVGGFNRANGSDQYKDLIFLMDDLAVGTPPPPANGIAVST